MVGRSSRKYVVVHTMSKKIIKMEEKSKMALIRALQLPEENGQQLEREREYK